MARDTSSPRSARQRLQASTRKPLRRVMAEVHLLVFDNLRALMRHYLEVGPIFSPTVEAEKADDKDYIRRLLTPALGSEARAVADEITDTLKEMAPKKVEDALR